MTLRDEFFCRILAGIVSTEKHGGRYDMETNVRAAWYGADEALKQRGTGASVQPSFNPLDQDVEVGLTSNIDSQAGKPVRIWLAAVSGDQRLAVTLEKEWATNLRDRLTDLLGKVEA